jgi:glycosyltransferase involved in cell wall biosynthesis
MVKNILNISSILPVPNYRNINDFVFKFSDNYLQIYPANKAYFILPVKISNQLTKKIIRDKTNFNEILKLKNYRYNNYNVDIIPYLSAQKLRNLHALISFTSYIFNRNFIKNFLIKNKINIVHAQYIIPDGVLAYKIWRKYNIPYVITSHNELKYFKHSLSRRIALRVLKHAAYVTPINYGNYELFTTKYQLINVLHIPLGFDESFLKYQRAKDHKNVRIITIAKLIPLKNIDKVIIALSKLKSGYDFEYTIVGEGPERNSLGLLIKKYNLESRIKLLGHIDHHKIPDILSENDIYVMPSYFETFGRVFFEAMATGLPVICAKYSGIYGFFKEMYEGISVNHKNINDLTHKLELLISDKNLRDNIGKNGRKLVKKYTWKNLAVEYNKLYNNSLAN